MNLTAEHADQVGHWTSEPKVGGHAEVERFWFLALLSAFRFKKQKLNMLRGSQVSEN